MAEPISSTFFSPFPHRKNTADLFSIAELVLGKIASIALEEAIEIYGVENQISELRETLTTIKAVLLGEEDQQAKKRNLQVWLDKLEDISYDVEDVFDELECEALRKQVIGRYGGVKEKVLFFSLSNPLILRDKLSHRVKEIKKRLSRISTEKDQFDLNVESADGGVAHMHSREVTYSYVNKSDVIGRDTDKEKIIEMLMQPTYDKNLTVIPIIGIGGVGKTTLAKLVYNDDGVKEKFELQLWVCVPEDFDLKKIIERIIEDATGQSLSNLDIQQLQTRLRDTIKDKKFLLVLDDVWSDDRRRWKELRDLLSVGASESKIIVTTRDSEVASIIGTHPAHYLEGLSHENSMALFKRWAFVEKEKEPRPELLEIGNNIVEKSQGVPLLAIILGSLLQRKDEEWYWAYIRDSEASELMEVKKVILPVLKLSYDNLPFHLKRCFSILSLFPKGDEIKTGKLTRLWIALGLISPTRQKQAPEDDIGVEYVKDLWRRSLIQDVEECGSELCFKVHDLVHSLATIVGQNCSTVDLDTPEILERVRYVSIRTASLEEISNYDGVPPFLRKETSKRLGAIMFQCQVDDGVITRKFARTCISKCNHLRYLDLSYGSFEELPSSICDLKQLRSLILSENKRLKKLPDTICELQSLLHLDVSGCSELDELPKNMKRLVNLSYLYITTKQKNLQESGVQYLENLQFLGVKACENLQLLFEGMCRLIRLRELLIENCGRLISLPFGELISLECLSIESCPLMLILKKSSFPSRLRVLSITSFEQVMELLQCLNESACTLKSLCIYDCPNFTAIPEWLPNHIHLREIRLIRCPNLSSMPEGIQSLTALKQLHILHCGELSKRCDPQSGKDWYKISHVPRIILDSKHIQRTEN
ncbi:disease resistance protein RGA2-like [Syzygium oleosum]|uniref:disease resistance protein RGA2-like n=1 Tax=Syzygium oleosum TaxID=219896 RepID=UPI0024BBE26F|nr:disease resistance protein RGA2-like [Syzygium oleosum]